VEVTAPTLITDVTEKDVEMNPVVATTTAPTEEKSKVDTKKDVVDNTAVSDLNTLMGLASTPVVMTKRKKRKKKTSPKQKVTNDPEPSTIETTTTAPPSETGATNNEQSSPRKRKRRKKNKEKQTGSEDSDENTKSSAAKQDTTTTPSSETKTTSDEQAKQQKRKWRRNRKGGEKMSENSEENTNSSTAKKDTNTSSTNEKENVSTTNNMTSEETTSVQSDSKKMKKRGKRVEKEGKTNNESIPMVEDKPKSTVQTTTESTNNTKRKRRKRKNRTTGTKDSQESAPELATELAPAPTPSEYRAKKRRRIRTSIDSNIPKTETAFNSDQSVPSLTGTRVHRVRHAHHIPRAIIRLAATPHPSPSVDNNAVVAPYLAVAREGGSVELVSVNEKWKCVGIVEGIRGRNVDAMAWVCGHGGAEQDDTSPSDVGHFCSEHKKAEEVYSNRTLIGASRDGTIFEVDFSTKAHKRAVPSGGGAVFCLTALDGASTLPSCGGLFAAGCEDGSVRIFDMVPGDDDRGRRRAIDLVCALPNVGSPILSIAWTQNISSGDVASGMVGTTLYAGVADGTIRKFECTSLSKGKKQQPSWKATTRITVESHGRATPTKIWSLLTLTDGTLVSGDSTGRIQFWDGLSCTLLQSFEHNNGKADVLDLAVSSDENKVMACGVDSKVVYIERQQKVDHKLPAAGTAASAADKNVARKWVMTVQRRLHTNDVNSLAVVFMTDPKGAAGYGTAQQQTATEMLCSGGIDTRVFSYPMKNMAQERPKLVYKYPQIAPLRLAKKARILGIMRCDRVDLFRMTKNAEVKEQKQRVGINEDKTFLGSIIIQGAHNLIVMDISDDGKYIALSDASSLYLFSLDVVKNKSSKSGSDEVIVPTRIDLPSSASTPSSALKFVPDDSQRLACATITGNVQILKMHNDKNDNNKPNLRVAVEHIFNETNTNTTATNLKSSKSTTTTYNFPITEIAISPDSIYVATGRNTMSTGSVHILTISPSYEDHYVLPCTESPYSCLAFLGGDDESIGGGNESNSCALAMGCNNGSFYVFDIERKCISDWSTDLGIPATKHLPMELNLQPDGPVRFACNPTTPNKFLMGAQNWFCTIDLDSPIPVHSQFSPADHLSALVRKAENEQRKQSRRHKGRKMPDLRNLTISLHFTGIIFMDFLSKDELVVVEQPWVDILNSLPDALERKRYGS